ncbi:MAG: transporter permease [Microbacterium sp.]|nr:transporter permease [Microbacterium sp.]
MLRAALLGLAGVLAVAALWEAYKFAGPADGVVVGELRVLPRTTSSPSPPS